MALQFRKVTEAIRLGNTFIPRQGEPILELVTGRLFIGDGETIGGVSVHNGEKLSNVIGVQVNYQTIKDRAHIYWNGSAWDIDLPAKNLSTLLGDLPSDEDFLVLKNTDPYALMGPFASFNASVNSNDVPVLYVNEIPTAEKWFIWSSNKFVASDKPSAPSLNDMPEVVINEEEKGDVLVYSGTQSKWTNQKLYIDPASPNFILDSSFSNKSFLMYDGINSGWKDQTLSFFSVNEIENATTIPANNALFYNANTSLFELRTFNYSLNNLPELNIFADETGVIDNGQVVAYDAPTDKWITPPDKVIGVTTGLGYTRRVRQEKNVDLGQDCKCLGEFEVPIEGDGSLNSIKVKGGIDRKYDLALFETEEQRKAFLASLTCSVCDAGQSGNFQTNAENNGGKYTQTDSNERTKFSDSTNNGRQDNLSQDLGGDQSGQGGGGGSGGGGGGGLPPGSGGSGRGDGNGSGGSGGGGTGGGGSGGGGSYGVILSRDKNTDIGDGTEDSVDIETDTSGFNEPSSPIILGWNSNSDEYGYYYKFLSTKKEDINLDPTYQSIYVHSKMRRCGCIVKNTTGFQVVYYNDADDSTKMAGDWIRVVERQVSSDFSGDITEEPSAILRDQINPWRSGAYYYKGNRVIYNDKLWECLVRQTTAVPASGTVSRPFTYNGDPIWEFVEIPCFRVWGEYLADIYQTELLLGGEDSGSATDGNFDIKVHPAFYFDETEDKADYLYVGVNLSTSDDVNGGALIHTNGLSATGRDVYLDYRSSHRQAITSLELDPGFFLYDYNVHSAIQLLMYTEFQSFNIEKYLGESNEAATINQPLSELNFANDIGNGSGMTQVGNSYGAPVGVNAYRGIFRPYGNQGYFIDGVNVNDVSLAVYAGQDPLYYSESYTRPLTFEHVGDLPTVSLTNGTGYSFWSKHSAAFNYDSFERSYFTPFNSIDPSSDRIRYYGDILSYRGVSTDQNVPLVVSIGKPYSAPLNEEIGGYGPFGYSISPRLGAENQFGRRFCIKRKGPTKDTSALGGSIPTGTNGVRTVGLRRVNKIEANVCIALLERFLISSTTERTAIFNALNTSYANLVAAHPEKHVYTILHEEMDKDELDSAVPSAWSADYVWNQQLSGVNELNSYRSNIYSYGDSGQYTAVFDPYTYPSVPEPMASADVWPYRYARDTGINGTPLSVKYTIDIAATGVHFVNIGIKCPDFYFFVSADVNNSMDCKIYIDGELVTSLSMTAAEGEVKVSTNNSVTLSAGIHEVEVVSTLEYDPVDFNSSLYPGGRFAIYIENSVNTVIWNTSWTRSTAMEWIHWAGGYQYFFPYHYGLESATQGLKTPQVLFGNDEYYYNNNTGSDTYIGFYTDWFDSLDLGTYPPGTKILVSRYGKNTTQLNNWRARTTFLQKCAAAGFEVTEYLIPTSSTNPQRHNWLAPF